MRSSIAGISVLLVALSSRAHAQSADAEALFVKGDALMQQGKLVEACDAFDASNRIETRAGTLIRLGECREQNHQLASAWSAYKDALTRVKDPKKREIARAKIAELEPKLSHLTLVIGADRRVDGLAVTRNGKPVDPGLWNDPVPVDGGDYEIAATAPGYEPWKTTVTVAITSGTSKVEVGKLVATPKPVAPLATAATPIAPVTAVRPRSRTLPFALGGAAIVALGGAVGLELSGESTYDQAKQDPDPAHQDSLWHSANTKRYAAEGLAVAGIAAAGVAVWLFLRPDTRETDVRTAHLIVSPTGIAIVGSY
jgi:hypothetical protein